MRTGDKIFIGWALFNVVFGLIVPIILSLSGYSLQGFAVGVLVWVGVPWLIYDRLARRRERKRQLQSI